MQYDGEIKVNNEEKCLFVTCAGFGNKNSSIIGFYLAYILSNKGHKISLIDLSSDCTKTQKSLKRCSTKNHPRLTKTFY